MRGRAMRAVDPRLLRHARAARTTWQLLVFVTINFALVLVSFALNTTAWVMQPLGA
jgi:hypothetical protein